MHAIRAFVSHCFIMSLVTSAFAAAADEQDLGTTITVEVFGLRSDDGQVVLSLHNNGDDFPGGTRGVVATRSVEVENARATCTFEDIPPGDYAIAVIHDEDADGELKTNFIGIPKEGTGASNNPKSQFGPPKWKDAKFGVGDEPVALRIRIVYL